MNDKKTTVSTWFLRCLSEHTVLTIKAIHNQPYVLIGPTLFVANPFVELLEHVEAFGHLTKHRMLVVQVVEIGRKCD